ncbi:hypothetical protein BJY24_001868 [Nocardia transvalensis]|uniref:GAF domain-containing protein n=1 Tax=Nocardia transvalensis TaxID=37333 RepID=A0A7W9PBD4_9NOCA|nr:GAF domain-containing protein [Nocardia transvalensis]MBB5913001.1 hypothetical protein [Nocardia transvalensis]
MDGEPSVGAHAWEQRVIDAEVTGTLRSIEELVVPKGAAHAELDILDPYRLAVTSPRMLLYQLLDAFLEHSDADKGNVQLFDPDRDGLVIAAQRGFRRKFLEFFDLVGDHGSACADAAARGTPVAVADVEHSSVFTRDSRDVMLESAARAVLSIPIASPTGEALGVISCHYPRARPRFDSDRPLLALLAEAAGRAIPWHSRNVVHPKGTNHLTWSGGNGIAPRR